jgi:putative ABC transport system permease protein
MIDTLISDLRLAARGLWRRPGFTLSCVAVLALGIGVVTTMYSALYAVVLRPLPFEDPDRLVWAWGTTEGVERNSISAEDYYDYEEDGDVFESLAAHLVWRPGRIVTGEGQPEKVSTTLVSANLFSTLGVAPLHGRAFRKSDEVTAGGDVVMLSYGYWQRRFGGDPRVVGAGLTVDDRSYEVVGVLPRSYDYPQGVELFFPMHRDGESYEAGRGNRNFRIIGRLAENVTLDQARTRMSLIAERLADTYPEANEAWGVRLVPLHERFVGDLRTPMNLLMGAVLLLLLVACANTSSLMLARMISRRHELALRLSLGASRRALFRQLLTESLVLATIGAGAGILLSSFTIELLRALGGASIPRLETMDLDGNVLLVAAAVTVLSGLLFGLAPALRSTRLDPVAHLKEGGRSTDAGRTLRLRNALVVGQVALCLVLLVGSGLLVRSLLRLQRVDPGFEPDGVLTMEVQLPTHYDSDETRAAFLSRTLERLRGLPGVRGASSADGYPPAGGPWNYVWPKDRPPATPGERKRALRRVITDGHFDTLGVPLLAGRTFEGKDAASSAPTTVVSRALAEEFFPGESAVGRVLILPWTEEGIPLEIIGVVGDVCDGGLDSDRGPVFYLPYHEIPGPAMQLALRGQGDVTGLAPAVRTALGELEKDLAISKVGTLAAGLSESTSDRRFQAWLLGGFAVAALLLAAVGLYGVLAYSVSLRTQEIGVRMAMGALGSDVVRDVVSKGALIAGTGIALGLGGGLAASRLLESLLYATAPSDPATYAIVSVLLAVVALAACTAPALKAARVDPAVALRDE